MDALSYKRIILLISFGIFIVFSILFWNYSIDDAFITFRYAENMANGHGLVFNTNDSPVEGYSNFLWLLCLAILFKIGLPTYLTAKVLGVGFFVAGGFIIYRRFERQPGYAWLAGPLLLICPFTVLWGVSGLELGGHTFLILTAIFYLVDKSNKIFIILPLLVLSRPEGAFMAVIMILASLISRRDEFKSNKDYLIKTLGFVLLTMTALTVFRFWYFDSLLPNTFYAKFQHTWWLGIRASYIMLMTTLPLTILAILGIYFLVLSGFKNIYLSLMSMAFLAQVFAGSLVNPVMNFHWRYLIPVMPLVLVLALSGLERFRHSVFRHAIGLIIVFTLVFPIGMVTETVKLEQEIIKSQEAFLAWAKTAEPGVTVSMTDMGRIPYYSGRNFNDLWGLVNRDIAREGYDLRRELERLPDHFVFVGHLKNGEPSFRFGREAVLAGNKAFSHTYDFVDICYPKGYNPARTGYYYLVFRKRPNAAEILRKIYSGEPIQPIR